MEDKNFNFYGWGIPEFPGKIFNLQGDLAGNWDSLDQTF